MIVSINPTNYCNFRCDFCYLTEQQLSDKKVLHLEVLSERLDEILTYENIDKVDVYGGEVGLLKDDYFEGLLDVCKSKGIDDINIITNLSMLNYITEHPEVYTTVSFDFDCREMNDKVWNNMTKLSKPFSVLILASEKILSKDVDLMIQQLNVLANLVSVEIKPYSTNQANCHNVTFSDFEAFVQRWIESPVEKKFEFVNEEQIRLSIEKTRNAFSNDHVYITPYGKFAVLEFDLNDNEFFLSLDSFEDYIAWSLSEIERLSDICHKCEYFGNCLTEHYRYVKDLDNSCNGFFNLLEWYNGRMENETRSLSQTQH